MNSGTERRLSWFLIFWSVLSCAFPACGTSPQLTVQPVKWVDPDRTPITTHPIKWLDHDRTPITKPRVSKEYQIWDIMEGMFFYPLGKLLDLEVTAQRLGGHLGVGSKKQADNLNALDEVANSSWYTNRHALRRMTREQLVRGPGDTQPNTGGVWEIIAGKFSGQTAGFTIRDVVGNRFVIKLDARGSKEMASGAEAISTRIFYAAGYNVPQNSVSIFSLDNLIIGPNATVPGPNGSKRPMTSEDLKKILARTTIYPDGTARCLASLLLDGEPVGAFRFHGRRRDDPNDRVNHEHRRELRGLRVLSSWLNDADRRTANTLDLFVTDGEGRGYIDHYIIDAGSTLGSNSWMPHLPKYGEEYLLDLAKIGKSILSAGLYRPAWQKKTRDNPLPLKFESIGYFDNQTFDPGTWVTTFPNTAYQWCTDRDGYWGAKIVMSFSDEDIVAIVETARYTDPEAGSELVRLLAERRDIIGRYWYGRVNPLDRFTVRGNSLQFSDLAVQGGLASARETTYRSRLMNERGSNLEPWQNIQTDPRLPLDKETGRDVIRGYEIQTRRGRRNWSKSVRVYFGLQNSGEVRIVRVEREE